MHELSGALAERLVQRINRGSGIHGFRDRTAFEDTRAKQAAIRRNDLGAEFDLGRWRGRRGQLKLSQVKKELVVGGHVFRGSSNRKPGIFETLDYFLLHEFRRAVAPFGPCERWIFVIAWSHQNLAGLEHGQQTAASRGILTLRGPAE